MALLLSLAQLLGIEVEELLEQFKKHAFAWVAIAIFALIGTIFLLVALSSWFTHMWGPIIGPLVIAGVALVIALAIYASLRAMGEVVHRREVQRRHSAEKTALMTTAALTALPVVLKSDVVRKIGIPIGGALVAAYLLSRRGADKRSEERD